MASATWGYLLQRYAAGAAAPLALLAPAAGVVASAVIFREIPGPIRLAGMALILVGLTVIVLPARWMGARAAPGEVTRGQYSRCRRRS